MVKQNSPRLEIFSGWKEIANYLGRGVRSVQRYERELALPIHRPAGKSHGAVIATKPELDAWVTAGPRRIDAMPKRWPGEQTNRLVAEFLQTDAEIALTFCAIALEAKDEPRKSRTSQTARKAYDTIMRLRKGIDLSDKQKRQLDASLQRLKSELETLGQSF
jgi:hypothetical protein